MKAYAQATFALAPSLGSQRRIETNVRDIEPWTHRFIPPSITVKEFVGIALDPISELHLQNISDGTSTQAG